MIIYSITYFYISIFLYSIFYYLFNLFNKFTICIFRAYFIFNNINRTLPSSAPYPIGGSGDNFRVAEVYHYHYLYFPCLFYFQYIIYFYNSFFNHLLLYYYNNLKEPFLYFHLLKLFSF